MPQTKAKAGVEGLTERQQKWFATVKANFEAKSGKSLAEWVKIARTCPHTAHRARLAWLKETYGLGQNHGSFVLGEAFPPEGPGWDDAVALRAALWSDAASLKILEAVEKAAQGAGEVLQGQRKGYTAFSKGVQFAAIRPLKGGKALFGLKLDPKTSKRLTPSVRKESWSERLSSVVELSSPKDVDAELKALFAKAYANG
ncbi:MAG TPA: DUF4287 domain-containing protein [Caulobacteraceae bacterium]|jgi:hypothetical protein|nr:DUF4287 domain-containing protein [Caulobacteraceae bacterium]